MQSKRDGAMENIAGILLAAGASRRMGRPKQLLPVGEFSLIEIVLNEALQSLLHTVVLVLGHESGAVKKSLRPSLLNHPKLKILINPDYEKGLSTSVVSALSMVEDEYDQVMFLLSDMPFLSASIINYLIKEYGKRNTDLCALKIKERRSLPVIVGRNYYHDIHGLKGDIGARELFIKYADKVALVNAPPGYRDLDLDTPEDYQAYLNTITE